MEQGCRGRQGPGEQIEGGKISRAGRAVGAYGMEACLERQSKTRMREGNRVQRAVQISLGVADRRGVITQRVKVTDPENSRTVGRGIR